MHVDIVVFSASDLTRTPSSNNLFDLNLYVSVHNFFSYVGTGLPGLTRTRQRLVSGSCSMTQGSDAGDVRTRNPLGFESCTLTLRCAPKISSEQNKIGPQK